MFISYSVSKIKRYDHLLSPSSSSSLIFISNRSYKTVTKQEHNLVFITRIISKLRMKSKRKRNEIKRQNKKKPMNAKENEKTKKMKDVSPSQMITSNKKVIFFVRSTMALSMLSEERKQNKIK